MNRTLFSPDLDSPYWERIVRPYRAYRCIRPFLPIASASAGLAAWLHFLKPAAARQYAAHVLGHYAVKRTVPTLTIKFITKSAVSKTIFSRWLAVRLTVTGTPLGFEDVRDALLLTTQETLPFLPVVALFGVVTWDRLRKARKEREAQTRKDTL